MFLPWYREVDPFRREAMSHGSGFFQLYDEGYKHWNGTQWDFHGAYAFALVVAGTFAALRHAMAGARQDGRRCIAPLLAVLCFAAAAVLVAVDATSHGLTREMGGDVVMRKTFGIFVTLAAAGLAAACAAWSSLLSVRSPQPPAPRAPRSSQA